MREDRHAVDEFMNGPVFGFGLRDIAFIYMRQGLAAVRRILRALLEFGQCEIAARTRIPLDGERRKPLARGTGIVGHDRNRVLDADDLFDALDRHCRLVIDGAQLAAEVGTDRDRRVGHAFRAGVDAEFCGTVDFLRAVKAPDGLADQLEARCRLQRHFLWNGLGCRRLNQAAIGSAASACGVNDLPGLGRARIRRNVPATRRSVDQHHTGAGTGLAHLLVNTANGEGTAGDLVAQQRVCVTAQDQQVHAPALPDRG